MVNYIDETNFNQTCRGYVIRALKEIDATEEEVSRMLYGLRFAFDDMTFEEARKEIGKYYDGKINFKQPT